MDGGSVRRIVFLYRHIQTGAVRQNKQPLHQALAEGLVAHQCAAPRILHRACENLRRTGAVFIQDSKAGSPEYLKELLLDSVLPGILP